MCATLPGGPSRRRQEHAQGDVLRAGGGVAPRARSSQFGFAGAGPHGAASSMRREMSPGRAEAPPDPADTTTGTRSKVRRAAGRRSGASPASSDGAGPPAAADEADTPADGAGPPAGAPLAAGNPCMALAAAGEGDGVRPLPPPAPLERRKGYPGVSDSVLQASEYQTWYQHMRPGAEGTGSHNRTQPSQRIRLRMPSRSWHLRAVTARQAVGAGGSLPPHAAVVTPVHVARTLAGVSTHLLPESQAAQQGMSAVSSRPSTP